MVGRKFVQAATVTALLSLGSAGFSCARTWTSDVGRTLEAELVAVDETVATLELTNEGLTNGTHYRVAIERLSAECQAEIKQWLASQGKSEFVDNFDAEFPKRASADSTTEVSVFKEDDEAKKFIYHTAHYEFICDSKLNTSVVRAFARMFEATFDFCRLLPISTQLAHQDAGQNRHKILLFADIEDYYKNGGPRGSAGVFMGGRNVIMVPLSSLGVERAGSTSYRIDHGKSNSTLPHEITHQLTDPCYYADGARGWFTEGLAEYVATTPYTSSGTFKISTNRTQIIERMTGYGKDGQGGRAIGKEIHMMPLRQWMQIPYSQFLANAQLNYAMGCLVTYYFFHFDNDGDRAAITGFLRALRAGKRGEEALAALLMGRTWEEMQEQITKGWRTKGVKITWAKDVGRSPGEGS